MMLLIYRKTLIKHFKKINILSPFKRYTTMVEIQYHLPNTILPNGMIILNSDEGQKLLNSGPDKVQKNERMIKLFKPQVNNTYCGAASLALVINATNTAYRVKMSCGGSTMEEIQEKQDKGEEITVDENDVVHFNNVEMFFKKINIDVNGMTLGEIAFVGMTLGYGEETYFAGTDGLNLADDKQNELSEILKESNKNLLKDAAEFREFLKDFFQRKHVAGLVCNYDMASLGYVEFKGHHSPLAAYNQEHDMVLVMDVWPKTQPAWVNTDLLFQAMSTVDSGSGLPRGIVKMYELM